MNDNHLPSATNPAHEPTIRERLATRRKESSIRVVPVEDLGDVRIRRLTAGRGNLIVEQFGDDCTLAMVVECLLDEQDKPIYSDVDELRREDWPLVQSLANACCSVNLLDTKAAEKK